MGYIRCIEVPSMTEKQNVVVDKTWRERWFPGFYEPWEPWIKTKTVTNTVPSPELLSYHDNRMDAMLVIGHPETIAAFKKNLRREYAAAASEP